MGQAGRDAAEGPHSAQAVLGPLYLPDNWSLRRTLLERAGGSFWKLVPCQRRVVWYGHLPGTGSSRFGRSKRRPHLMLPAEATMMRSYGVSIRTQGPIEARLELM
jgi:hypothetical protein